MSDPASPQDPSPGGSPLLDFADLMRRLRVACSWKAEQTHASLRRFLLEEAYETLEAIDLGEETGDWAPLREELGDLLLQVYFHAVLAEERGEFTLDDVAADIHAKMVRRNPHVFGPHAGEELTPAQVDELWQAAKAEEKAAAARAGARAGTSAESRPDAGLPPGLPALLWADKVLDRAERAGRPVAPAHADALEGLDPAERVGEELLAVVLRAREAGVDAEQALRGVVRRRLAADS